MNGLLSSALFDRHQNAYLYKVPRVHLFKCDLQVEDDVIPPGDVSVLLLPVPTKHEPKIAKETERKQEKILRLCMTWL